MDKNNGYFSKTRTYSIITFGDSTTALRGGFISKVYNERLEDNLLKKGLNVHVSNAGVCGNTTADAKQRYYNDIIKYNPDMVIIQFGINDSIIPESGGKPRLSILLYEKNLRFFVLDLLQNNKKCILMTPNLLRWSNEAKKIYGYPPYNISDPEGFNLYLKNYVNIVRKLALDKSIPLVDVYKKFEEYDKIETQSVNDDLLLDGIHPNDKGHSIIADMLTDMIVAMINLND